MATKLKSKPDKVDKRRVGDKPKLKPRNINKTTNSIFELTRKKSDS